MSDDKYTIAFDEGYVRGWSKGYAEGMEDGLDEDLARRKELADYDAGFQDGRRSALQEFGYTESDLEK